MMTSEPYAAIGRICDTLGVDGLDVGNEHERWSLYLRAVDERVCWPDLRVIAAREGDSSISLALVLRMLERVPAGDREGWALLLPLEKSRDYALGRAYDLAVLEEVANDREASRDYPVEAWSAWLQLRLAETSTNQRALMLLSSMGETKRIRSIATTRMR